MQNFPFVDIHTHLSRVEQEDCLSLCSLRPKEFALSKPSLLADKTKFYSVGLHPFFEEDMEEQLLDYIAEANALDCLSAVGEIGLDKRSFVAMDRQITLFKKQIELAEAYQKPVVIHLVKAYNELLDLYDELKPSTPWLIHGFRAKSSVAKLFLDRGIYLSFGQYYNEQSLQLAYKKDLFFLETDENNIEIGAVYQSVAEDLSISIADLRGHLYHKFVDCFRKFD